MLLDPAPEIPPGDDLPEANRNQIEAGDHDEYLVAGSCTDEGILGNAGPQAVGVNLPAQAGAGARPFPRSAIRNRGVRIRGHERHCGRRKDLSSLPISFAQHQSACTGNGTRRVSASAPKQ